MPTIDLSILPEGQSYEDRYQGYIDVFRTIAGIEGSRPVTVTNPPWSWVPLLYHLNCEIQRPRLVFAHCANVRGAWVEKLDRTAIEVLCCFRPETVDVLWKIDMQWSISNGRVRDYEPQKEFIVTNNGSYHRKEVLNYIDNHLEHFNPSKKNVVLVPCAADKPYPSPMHMSVIELLPDNFYLMNATGVLGLVPDRLWQHMPWYDSGIPNQWRLFEITKWYFDKHPHNRVVVYCDFYSETLHAAFKSLDMLNRVDFVLPVQRYDDYVDLMSNDNLGLLRSTLNRSR